MRTSLTVALLALIAACTQEASITDPQCGNYVLDRGEDCDRPGIECTTSCRIACVAQPPCQAQTMPPVPPSQCPFPRRPSQTTTCTTPDAIDGTCCPTGMACGVDGTCHSAAGVLLPEHATVFDTITFVGADINGDYIDDAIGVSRTDVLVAYGNADAPFASISQTPAPAPVTTTGEVSFGDFNGDGHDDIIVSAPGGLFALDDASGTPAPLDFPVNGTAGQFNPGIVTGVTHERVAPVYLGGDPVLVELDRVGPDGAASFRLDVIATPTPPVGTVTQLSFKLADEQLQLCSSAFTKEDSVVRGRALHPILDTNTIRVPLAMGTNVLCIATANPSTPMATPSISVTKNVLQGAYRFSGSDGETFFANLISPAGSCPDLVVPVVDLVAAQPFAMILKGTGTIGTNGCAVDQVSVPTFVSGMPLAAIVLDMSTVRPGLITAAGVYAYNSTTLSWVLVTPPTRTWRYAAVADLDGDGRPDFATIGPGTDVEVFRQLAGDVLVPRWSDYVIQTQNTVERIGLGNFDGDHAGDVAIATINSASPLPIPPADLAIAWGSVDGSFTQESYGEYAEPYDLTAVALFDSSLPIGVDSSDDLILARGGADPTNPNDPALLVAEYGSTARALAAPFAYASMFGGGTLERAHGVASLVGRFGAGGAPGVFGIFSAQTQGPFSMLDLTYNPYTTAFDASAESVGGSCIAGGPTLDAPFCASTATFIQLRRDSGGDLAFGYRKDIEGAPQSECAGYFVANGVTPVMSTISCAELAPDAAKSMDPNVVAAFANLTGIDRLQVMQADGTTAHVLIASPNTVLVSGKTAQHVAQAFLWDLSVTPDGKPLLANPIAINPELSAANVLDAGKTAACFGATSLDLGKRVDAGTVYGDGVPEVVLSCSIGPYDSGNYRTQLWGRFADPGGGQAHYELLADLKQDMDVSLRSGDFDGNGLADIVFAAGIVGTGAREVHVLLQADCHQVDEKPTGCTM